MAEKNTLSILETIKKKMHKLDQKTDKSSKISDLNDEFEYISSTPKQEAPQPVAEVKAPEPAAVEVAAPTSVLEDDLDLDALEASVQALDKAPVQSSASNKEPMALDDFNLDDLDLDDEAPAAQSPIKETAVIEDDQEEEEFSEDDIEDYEDEVDFDEEGELEAMAEIEDNTLVIENEPNEGLDWLGNKIEDEYPEEEEAKHEELDLEFPEEEDELSHDEEEQEVEEEHEFEEDHDDLNLDDFELPEENIPAPKQQPLKEEHAHDDDFDFDDLDLEEEVKEEKKLPEFDISTPAPKRQEHSKDIEDFLERKPAANRKEQEKPVLKEPISLEDEIDLEFEKEIMGLKPEVIQKPLNQEPEQIFQQPILQQQSTPIQNNTAPMNESGLVVNPENRGPAKIIYDSTLRQTSDSIKKLLDAKNVVSGISSFSQGSAFAELAMQLMEPKMEKWLNEHLPDLVEKIVREEIKKIIPKE